MGILVKNLVLAVSFWLIAKNSVSLILTSFLVFIESINFIDEEREMKENIKVH